MEKRTLEEQMEVVRKHMEETAGLWGLGHPKVYQLSRELDELHNMWEKEFAKKRLEKIYRIHPSQSQVREGETIQIYNVV